MGGVGDGETDNTALLRQLFAECDEVIVPEGQKYLTHPLNITRNNFVLVLEGTLLASTNASEDWPIMPHLPSYPSDRDVGSCCRYQPILLIWKTNNVTLQGSGTLDGQGSTWWTQHHEGALQYGRPRLLETMFSTQVQMKNITMKDSPFWTCHLYASEGIEISGVQIVAPVNSPNTDGFDPDSSHYVHIVDSHVSNGDDCVAIKSGMDNAGIAFNKSSAHIVIERLECEFTPISIGSEVSGGVEDVFVSDSKSQKLYLKTSASRGGYIRDITYFNCQVSGSDPLLTIETDFSSHGAPPAPTPTRIQNIRFENLNGKGSVAGQLICSDEIPCDDLLAFNIDFATGLGFQCQNVTTAFQNNVHPPWCGRD